MRSFSNSYTLVAVTLLLSLTPLCEADADTKFHNAPASAQAARNPYEGQEAATHAGSRLYARNCLACHGKLGKGSGNVPSLVSGKVESATPGEVFWFITRGDKNDGMPSWAFLPAKQRWEIVTYVKALEASQ